MRQPVGQTEISASLARLLLVGFVATVLVVPVTQIVCELVPGQPGQLHEILRPIVAGWQGLTAAGGPVSRILTGNRAMLEEITGFSDGLEEQSVLGGQLRPLVQAVLTERFGIGSKDVYVGHGGWLFFRPAVEHLTGPGFLEPGFLTRRADPGGEPVQPDPRLAVLQFSDQLASRGIELILLPIPVKGTIHPEQLAGPGWAGKAPENRSFEAFIAEMEAAGVKVFDPTATLLAARSQGPAYLAFDTHWRPQASAKVAAALAEFILATVDLAPSRWPGHTRERRSEHNRGDLAVMLSLPREFAHLYTETVELDQVLVHDDMLWRPNPGADVLLLGDSFSNVYSLSDMKWGESAGFAEQLSYHLQRPLATNISNHNGAFATRGALNRELWAGRDQLAGKRLVIWEFSARELSAGNWTLFPMKFREPGPRRFVVPPIGTSCIVEGRVAATGEVPRPRSAPYRNHIVAIHLVDLDAATSCPGLRSSAGPDEAKEATEAVVFMMSMRSYTLTTAAGYRPGQRLRLRLRNWQDVVPRYGMISRGELTKQGDYELLLAEPAWADEAIEVTGSAGTAPK